MDKNNKYLNIIITSILFICTCFISIGYSAINTNLTISGEALYIPPNSIKISAVNLITANDAHENYSSSFIDSGISFNPYLNTISSSLEYEITITNNSPVDYILKDITEDIVTNEYIAFRINDFSYGSTLPANSSTIITLVISSLRSNQTGTLSLKLLYGLKEELPTYETLLTGASSTTDSYIKTGFFPSSESRIVLDFTFLGPRGVSTWLFSSRKAYQNQMFGIAWNTSESLLQFNTVSYNLGYSGYKINTRYTADISKDGLILDGVNYANPVDTPWQGIFEFYMFANNEARTVRGPTNGQAIIHHLQIYESGVLVLDAIPVELETGEVVFWNNVTNVALTNVGTLIGHYEEILVP